MRTRRMTTAVVGTAAALTLAACGSSGAEGDGADTTASTPSEATSETSAESTGTGAGEEPPAEGESGADESGGGDETEPAGGGAELTEPGTELALGEPGTIPQGDDGATLTLTVTRITKGSSKDLSVLENAEDYKQYTPVYVHYEMTGTDTSGKLGGDILDDVEPMLASGQRAPTLSIIGTSPFEKCDLNDVPDDFGPGDTATSCAVAMVVDGQEVSGAMYDSGEGRYADAGKVVWTE